MKIERQKIIRDPIHGDIKTSNLFVDLLETPEIQRLYHIKQLGFAHLVFPGAHHTRLEHSLGSYYIASQIAQILDLHPQEKDLLSCAALLHDIGHGPFSHTLESILWEKYGVDHVDLTEKLILGEYDIFQSGEREFIQAEGVPQILSNHDIGLEEVLKIIKGKTSDTPYLSQLLHGAIDVDQLDYLLRDAYYTGVAYGMIDIERLLQTIMLYDDKLAINRKGVNVVENILMARGLMYSSVYFHKTIRIAELMLSKAFEKIPDFDPFDLFRMTDAEIITKLKNMGRYQYEIGTRIKYRELFKQAYSASVAELSENELNVLTQYEDVMFRRKKEQELESVFGIPEGHLIIDIPRPELLRAEPRIQMTEIDVVDGNTIKLLDEYTPIAKAIRARATPNWVVMIITEEKFREKVAHKAKDFLFN